MGLSTLLAVAAVAAAAAGTGAVVASRPRREVDVATAVLALAGAGVATVGIAAVVVLDIGRAPFTMVHIAYLAATVTVPAVGAALLALGARHGSTGAARAAAVALLLPAPLGAYATHVAPHRLAVDHVAVPVPAARQGDDPVRIAVLADLQTSGVGDHERAAVEAVLDAEPDVVVLPGDLFQGSEDQWRAGRAELRALLDRLEAPGGVFYVRGDVDGGGRAEHLLEGTGITILDDEVVETTVGDRTVRIGGTRLDYASPAADRVRAELAAEADTGALTVLVSHRPDTVLHLPEAAGVDLTVAGHTHGGQVVVPGFGPPLTLSDVPRDVARGGLHEVDGNPIYVSPGVGLERGHAPQVRLFTRPTVAVLTLDEQGSEAEPGAGPR